MFCTFTNEMLLWRRCQLNFSLFFFLCLIVFDLRIVWIFSFFLFRGRIKVDDVLAIVSNVILHLFVSDIFLHQNSQELEIPNDLDDVHFCLKLVLTFFVKSLQLTFGSAALDAEPWRQVILQIQLNTRAQGDVYLPVLHLFCLSIFVVFFLNFGLNLLLNENCLITRFGNE